MACPTLPELESLLDASSEASCGTLSDHVSTCADCQRLLTELRANRQAAESLRRVWRRAANVVAEGHSRLIGPYRLIRHLGRGGMGTVYEAIHTATQRRVALKLLHAERPSAATLKRFDREARILGRLRHPGIAQIYDAGTHRTELGDRPYLVMELIEGRDIRRHVHEHGLPVGERLSLIAAVCEAVHVAHQLGVVHRDLKPANILVGRDGQPKVVDFGVARLTDPDALTSSLRTGSEHLIGTVPYMSPEQTRGDAREADARSDVYALGVIAYELLTGRLPYALEHRALPEALDAIRHQDPTPIGALDQTLGGDIQTVIGKALAKEPQRRYDSAGAFAADIRRYLRNEPVLARRPSAAYRIRKFVRRHRALVAATTALVTVLAATSTVTTFWAIRAVRAERLARQRLDQANRSRTAAERQAARFAAVNRFLEQMLTAADPGQNPAKGEMTVRQLLERARTQLDAQPDGLEPQVAAAARTAIGNTYRALGRYDDARALLRAAVDQLRKLSPEADADLAYALNKLGRTEQEAGRLDEAEAAFGEALAIYRRVRGERHADVAKLLNNLGWLRHQQGNYVEAERLGREALAMRRELLGDAHVEIATSLNNIAVSVLALGRRAEAAELLRESLEMDRALRGDLHPNVAATMSNLATVIARGGDYAEAEALMREALHIWRTLYGEAHPQVATGLNNLAFCLTRQGRHAEAETLLRRSLEIDRATRGPRHLRVATTLDNLARALARQGRFDEAEAAAREALAIAREAASIDHPDALFAEVRLAELLMERGRWDKAAVILERAIAGGRRALPPGHPWIGVFLSNYGACLTRLDQPVDAEAALTEAFETLLASNGLDDRQTRRAARRLADLYDCAGQPLRAAGWRSRAAARSEQAAARADGDKGPVP